MNKFIMASAAAVILSACADEAPVEVDVIDNGGDPDVEVTNGVVSLGDLTGANFDGSNLTVIITLDGNNVQQTYDAEGVNDGGYSEFSQQLSETDRIFTGFGAESSDGGVQAVVVSDGGQFNRFFGGAFATQNDYTAPTSGIINYSGSYIGLVNFPSLDELPGEPAEGDSVSAVPSASGQVVGEVIFKADFSDNAVNGSIFNRNIDGEDLPEIVLTVGDIAADGSFTGTVELLDLTAVGQYGGIFGGDGATSVAGVVRLEDGFLDDPFAEVDEDEDEEESSGFEIEHGIFVLDAD